MNLHGNIKIFINEKMIYCILVFSLIIRILKVEEIPPGFYVDEVVFGYDAYSLITTGRDSDGNLLPIYFRHLGTYVDPIYVYSIIPLILLFGNTFFSKIYFCSLWCYVNFYYLSFCQRGFQQKIALLTSLFLALSPWHFFFSRVGFQCISFTFYFTLSLYFLLKSLQNKPRFLYLGFIILGISIYTYFVSRLCTLAT
jgi:4-amino-4-deoxy-L-arabinose transferase-like glycosyltransferase